MKPILPILLLFSLISLGQPSVDTIQARIGLQKSKELHFKDALAARDITYQWTNIITQTDLQLLKAELQLQHSKNDAVCGSAEAGIEGYQVAIQHIYNLDSNHLIIAEAQALKGRLLNQTGESHLGLAEILLSKRMYEEFGMPKEVSWCNVLIAECYANQGRMKQKVQLIENAILELEKYPPSLYLLDAYYTFVRLTYLINDSSYQKANQILDHSLSISKKMDNQPYFAMGLVLQGKLLEHKGEIKQARERYVQAYHIFMETNFLINAVGAKVSEGWLLNNENKYEEVLIVLKEPIELAAKSGWLLELFNMYSIVANAHSALGNQREGAINGSRAFTISKHTIKENKVFEMEKVEAIYEKEKQIRITAAAKKETNLKEQQRNLVIVILLLIFLIAIILFYFNQKIKQTNKLLSNSLNQKEVLLQEVHHRVKNNLAMLNSLLYLQAEQCDNQETKLILNECQTRIHSMGQVHQNLYDVDDSSKVDFKKFIHQLISDSQEIFSLTHIKINPHVSTNNIQFDMSFTIYLGLILNELITNSFKYAFSPEKENSVTISIQKNGDQFTLNYTDSGLGLPNELSISNTTGFGFKLINIMISQIKGSISYSHQTNNFTIQFSKP